MRMNKLYSRAAVTVLLGIIFSLAAATALAQENQERHPDDLSYLGGLFEPFMESSLSLKVWTMAAIALVTITLYLHNRNTPANNIRRARALHKKGIASHERGDGEAASEYYRKAAALREKAEARE